MRLVVIVLFIVALGLFGWSFSVDRSVTPKHAAECLRACVFNAGVADAKVNIFGNKSCKCVNGTVVDVTD